MKFQALKGTRDILPAEASRWRWVEERVRAVMGRYNYGEIRIPTFERTELFIRGIGENTDIVNKEMYTFLDRGGRSLTLRPEGTAGVIRAFIEHNLGEQTPLNKLYYISSFFRQERPQAGRFREYHQFGVEAIGSSDPALDVEVISLCLALFRELGLNLGIRLRLNSIGCRSCQEDYRMELRRFMEGTLAELCPDCLSRYERNPLRALDCKKRECRKALERAPSIIEKLCPACSQHLRDLRSHLRELKIDYFVDKNLVRGLDYYTRTVFEFVSDELGAQDSLCGGGRYDNLVEELGGKPTPAVGFAAGMERTLMVLEKVESPFPTPEGVNVFIAPLGDEAMKHAIPLLNELRSRGISGETDYHQRSLKAQLKEANRQNAQYVIIIGPNELQRGEVVVRSMATGQQLSMEMRGTVADGIKEVLSRGL